MICPFAHRSGWPHFLDALHLVRDALAGSLGNALNERGRLQEVRRKSSGHPAHFGIRLEFRLRDGRNGHYAFNVGALSRGGYEVQTEECAIGRPGADRTDDPEIPVESLLAVDAAAGETRIARLDAPSRDALRERLFSAGELLRLNQLAPDPQVLDEQARRQPSLFGDESA